MRIYRKEMRIGNDTFSPKGSLPVEVLSDLVQHLFPQTL